VPLRLFARARLVTSLQLCWRHCAAPDHSRAVPLFFAAIGVQLARLSYFLFGRTAVAVLRFARRRAHAWIVLAGGPVGISRREALSARSAQSSSVAHAEVVAAAGAVVPLHVRACTCRAARVRLFEHTCRTIRASRTRRSILPCGTGVLVAAARRTNRPWPHLPLYEHDRRRLAER